MYKLKSNCIIYKKGEKKFILVLRCYPGTSTGVRGKQMKFKIEHAWNQIVSEDEIIVHTSHTQMNKLHFNFIPTPTGKQNRRPYWPQN